LPPTDAVAPRVVPRSEHSVSRSGIQKEALKVMYRLQSAGYLAYMVGGSVRDLMLGRVPKDFDIATDARPQEIRRLFRNARIIGRRFRLVHILFGDVVVEVSTFRGRPSADGAVGNGDNGNGNGGGNGDPEPSLLITSDNNFGTPVEDAFRRDFTVNALFYNIADFSILDYVGGIDDLRHRVLRVIGEPRVRFHEDPVRMLRACELAGRLSFTIDRATQSAIHESRRELEKASPARVTEELVALLRCKSAGAAMQWMLELGLLEVILPEAYAMVSVGERGLGDFGRLLPTLDRKVASGAPISDGALLAALLLPNLLLRRFDVEALSRRAMKRHELATLVGEICEPFFKRFTLSKIRAQQTADALLGFLRLCEPHRNTGDRQHSTTRPWFRDALWLFELLAEATGEGFEELAQWQAAARRRPVLATGEPAPTHADELVPPAARRRNRRRGRRRPH
jgi:poly(A) polymerase